MDGPSITIIQRQNIKGKFVKDVEITYKIFTSADTPEVGKQYLCGFPDDNNPVYIWEVTGFDTNTLKIKNDDNMSRRMQEYLNNGDFAQKELERVPDAAESKTTLPSVNEETMAPSINTENQTPAKRSTHTYNGSLPVFALIFCGGLSMGSAVLKWKKKKNR